MTNVPNENGDTQAPHDPDYDPATGSQWSNEPLSWNEAARERAMAPRPEGDDNLPSAPRPRAYQDQQADGGSAVEQPSLAIEQYRQRPNRMIPILVIALVIGIALGITWLAGRPTGGDEPTPTPTRPPVTRSAPNTPGAESGAIPFERDSLSGVFTVHGYEWVSDNELVLDVSLEVHTGSLYYKFGSMQVSGSAGTWAVEKEPTDITDGNLYQGEIVVGTVRFETEREDLLVFISDGAWTSNLTSIYIEA